MEKGSPIRIDEIKSGNLILCPMTSGKNVFFLRQVVKEIQNGIVCFENGEMRRVEDCNVLHFDDYDLAMFGVRRDTLPEDVKYWHHLQNTYGKTKYRHVRCINCDKPHGWNEDEVFNYEIPVAKRLWPIICEDCKIYLRTRYKSGVITKTQLLLEFSNISAKVAKALTKDSPAIRKLEEFKPQRRGK